MARGPAALLAIGAAGLAYLLLAGSRPAPETDELAILLAGGLGAALVVALACGVVGLADAPPALAIALVGAGLVVGALDAAGTGVAATPFEAVLLGCVGAAFARTFALPSMAIALPLVVGAIDLAGAIGGSGSTLTATAGANPDGALALDLPRWGSDAIAVRIGIADVVLLAAFTTYARRLDLRERPTILAALAALLVAIAGGALWDADLPPLALMAAAFLVVNADRLMALTPRLREE